MFGQSLSSIEKQEILAEIANCLCPYRVNHIQAAFRGYLVRKDFKFEVSWDSLDLFTNSQKFCSVFSEFIQERILDFLNKNGMFLTNKQIKSSKWSGPITIPEKSLYYGETNTHSQPHGLGVLISSEYVSEGFWNCGKLAGWSRRIHINDGIYTGYWSKGERIKFGYLKGWDGSNYEGTWEHDKKSGNGKFNRDGMYFEGYFDNDKIGKYGTLKVSNKYEYRGEFCNELFGGYGDIKYVNGEEYEGFFQSGKYHGKGNFYYSNGWVYRGNFSNGKREGAGTLSHRLKGKFTNQWKDDKFVGEYIFTDRRCINWKGCWINAFRFSYMDEIIPNLYLGSAEAAQDQEFLNSFGIKFILRVLNNEPVNLLPGMIYYHAKAKDDETENIAQHFSGAIQFIDQCLSGGNKILVHCYKGVSRSATIVLAFLISKKLMSLSEAILAIKKKRSFINPNKGFLKTLEDFVSNMSNMC